MNKILVTLLSTLIVAGANSQVVMSPEPVAPVTSVPSEITMLAENCYIERVPGGFAVYPKQFGRRFQMREWTPQELASLPNHSTRLGPSPVRAEILRKKEMWPGNLKPIQLSKPWVGEMGFKKSDGKWSYMKGYVVTNDLMFCDPQPVFYGYYLRIHPSGAREWWFESMWNPRNHVTCGNPVKGAPVWHIQKLDNMPMEIVSVPGPTQTLKECNPVNLDINVYVQVTVVAPAVQQSQAYMLHIPGAENSVNGVRYMGSESATYFYFPTGSLSRYCDPRGIVQLPPPPGLIGVIGTPPNNPEHGPTPFGGPYVGPPIVPNGPGGYKNANGGQSSSGGGGPPPA